jgi:hypothetical protein
MHLLREHRSTGTPALGCREVAHLGASGSAFNSGQLEQGPHLIEREAQFACPADEHKSPHIGSAIAAIPPGAIWHRKHADALIVADRLTLRDFMDWAQANTDDP